MKKIKPPSRHVISFKSYFTDRLLSGKKTTTIRRERKRPIKVGDTVSIVTGMRTKNYKKLFEARVIATPTIAIHPDEVLLCALTPEGMTGKILKTEKELRELAVIDGFLDFDQMLNFFDEHYGLPFEGVLIEWVRL
ncbi:MAG: ASCH domain-containing protein [Leptospiraceae bacterium]|nr:ASCH domain-containing protein [Leptospiraceae bacterium]